MTAHAHPRSLLVFGATGRTGRHFTRLALDAGHQVHALVRAHSTPPVAREGLHVFRGSITDPGLALEPLLAGIDAVVVMLGDATGQRTTLINTAFIRRLVPAMRATSTTRLLYQAGGLSAPPSHRLPLPLRLIRATIAHSYIGQHKDNEAVMRFLTDEAQDIDWVVHRASIGSDGPPKGILQRSTRRISIATFTDCADYNLRLLFDAAATHTCSPSSYRRRPAL